MLGKMNSTSGKISFTVVLAATSSACCRRFWRRRIGKHAQRLHQGRAEAIGLRQHVNETFDRLQPGAVGHTLPGLDPRLAGPLLEVDLDELLRHLRLAQRQLLSGRAAAPDRCPARHRHRPPSGPGHRADPGEYARAGCGCDSSPRHRAPDRPAPSERAIQNMVLLRMKVPARTASHRPQQPDAEVGVHRRRRRAGRRPAASAAAFRPAPGPAGCGQSAPRPATSASPELRAATALLLQAQRRPRNVHQALALVAEEFISRNTGISARAQNMVNIRLISSSGLMVFIPSRPRSCGWPGRPAPSRPRPV